MPAAIYKPGQGYWTRTMTAIGLGLLVIMGALWVADLLANVRIAGYEPIYTQAAVVILILGIFGTLGYWLIGAKPRVVDFMIATESEMKKVNWSTKREIVGSTWVVIGLTVFIGLFCLLFDLTFQWFFQVMKVLDT